MSLPTLSLVTITKDDPAALARTLASTAGWRQRPGVQQIVVFAGAEPAAWPEGVCALRQTGDGIASAFNEGLQVAQGEWVWFLNGGDAIHEDLAPEWLETLLARTRADLVIGSIQGDGDAAPRELTPLREQWPLLHSWPPHPATLVRREVLRRAGGFSPRYRVCMDFDLWQRLLGAGARADVIAVPLARFDLGGLSSRPENAGLVFRENGDVLWRHQGAVWRTIGRGGWGLMVGWLRALRHRFL
ncbi:putative glycosyl transferase [Lacunisphaera limnophila]|uniref:Putative glycosyl transferase n=1 Tax=Lacunisphaera limnophila TaxID=1838286 RepID=A0A1D8AUH8_9BACT|nr:glycosyltransferase family 2 protein [Lacunisphaera limnophila]AOS44551.1 putative glycosyl transferase [Lacunisphaera limnophila]